MQDLRQSGATDTVQSDRFGAFRFRRSVQLDRTRHGKKMESLDIILWIIIMDDY